MENLRVASLGESTDEIDEITVVQSIKAWKWSPTCRAWQSILAVNNYRIVCEIAWVITRCPVEGAQQRLADSVTGRVRSAQIIAEFLNKEWRCDDDVSETILLLPISTYFPPLMVFLNTSFSHSIILQKSMFCRSDHRCKPFPYLMHICKIAKRRYGEYAAYVRTSR